MKKVICEKSDDFFYKPDNFKKFMAERVADGTLKPVVEIKDTLNYRIYGSYSSLNDELTIEYISLYEGGPSKGGYRATVILEGPEEGVGLLEKTITEYKNKKN